LSAAFLPVLWVCENFVGEQTGVTSLLTYLPQHPWGVVPLVCGVLALRKRRFKLAMLCGVALAFWMGALMGLRLHPFGSGSKDVRIVTYNVAMRAANADEFALQIQAQHPDIICLQEARRSYPPERAGENPVGQAIAAHFPGWHRETAGDVSTLSRFPVLQTRVFPLRSGSTRRTLATTIQTPHGQLRVLNTHISTAFSGEKKHFGLPAELADVSANARAAAQARLEQVGPLDTVLNADTKMPLVLCGDFNTPPRGLFYRRLSARLNDGFAQSGNGLGLSFPTRFPLLRIDYVWTRGARASSVRVDKAGASDHRMVIADVSLP
jgi:vancomycin resistance protein VanJ